MRDKHRLRPGTLGVIALTGLLHACTGPAPLPLAPDALPGSGADLGKTVLYRDDYGVAHIYAPTVNAGLFAQGYAQAQDRPSQLLVNMKLAMGELASVAGPEQVAQDLLARLFDHYGNAKRRWQQLTVAERAPIRAFTDGINAFYAAHPEDLPQWWTQGPVTPQMIGAFGRLFLYNWSIDEALEDLQRGGISPSFATSARGSNQWAIAPSRSASGNALLLVDPHLSWWGPSRFWEMRVHAGALVGSGVGLAGSPYIGLGHNDKLAWSMTTGGPDTADVYELQLNPDDLNQYRYDGQWRSLEQRTVVLTVRGGDKQTHQLQYSHHGPVLATVLQDSEDIARDGEHRAGPRAYAARIAYDEHSDRNRAWRELNFAKDYTGVQRAAATQALFPQNVMAADTQGNIYYQRVGSVPRRDPSVDWSKPVDGSTRATEWQGVHNSDEHLALLNPPAGFMQNCNIPPDAMLASAPFSLDAQPNYLYTSASYGTEPSGWSNLRGARALELLAADDSVTIEEALAYAVDVKPFGVERWLAALRQALSTAAVEASADELSVLQWNGELRRDSVPALRYAYWRSSLAQVPLGPAIRQRIDDPYASAAGRAQRPVVLTAAMQTTLRQAFATAMTQLGDEFGNTDVAYGQVFRVGRDDRSWPVGGGSPDELGLTTLRSVGYGPANAQHQRLGVRGQTSTQLIELSEPIRSWIYLPVGQSDRPDSGHYTDQAAGPFSQRQLRPSWWTPTELADHIQSRTVLNYPAKP